MNPVAVIFSVLIAAELFAAIYFIADIVSMREDHND